MKWLYEAFHSANDNSGQEVFTTEEEKGEYPFSSSVLAALRGQCSISVVSVRLASNLVAYSSTDIAYCLCNHDILIPLLPLPPDVEHKGQ